MIAPHDAELLLSYLDGALPVPAESALHGRLKAEPELAQELVRLARTESVLREWAQAMQLADPDPAPTPTRRPLLFWLAASGLLAATLLGALSVGLFSALPNPEPVHLPALARLMEAVGRVELLHPSGLRSTVSDPQDLAQGQTLHVGGGGSRARVEYADGSSLDLTAGTTVRLEGGPGTTTGKQVILIDGYVYAAVQPQPEDRPMVMTTPHAVIRVPGTRFSSATQQDATRVELEEGKLQVVRTSDGQSIDVSEGLYAIIANSEPALMPEPLPPRFSQHRDVVKHGGGPILSIAFAPNSNLLAVGGFDGSILLWDADKRQPWRQWKAHPARVKDIAWMPGGKSVLTVGQDKQVKLWDAFTGEEKSQLKLRKEAEALALSPDGTRVAIALVMGKGGPNNEQIRIFDLPTGQEVGKLIGHNQQVTSLVFLPDGKTLATAGKEGHVKLWSLETQTELATLRGHLGVLNTVAVDPDGRLLASGGRDGSIKLWDIAGRTEIRSLPGHPREVRCVAFSPDGRTLASCGTDGAARLWDVQSGQEILHLTGMAYAAPAVAFSRDGQFLGASAWDPLVKVWEVPAALRPRRPGL